MFIKLVFQGFGDAIEKRRLLRTGACPVKGSMNARVVVRLVILSAVLGVIPLVSELIFVPLHRREIAQPLFAPINAVGRVLATPGVPAVEMLGLRSESHTTTAGAILSSLIAAVAYFLLFGVLLHIWRRISEVPSVIQADASVEPAANPSRRGLLRGGMQAASPCALP